jgi:hypothetical protein
MWGAYVAWMLMLVVCSIWLEVYPPGVGEYAP